jgi:hypothetical protein
MILHPMEDLQKYSSKNITSYKKNTHTHAYKMHAKYKYEYIEKQTNMHVEINNYCEKQYEDI